jgi:hypothetical protein
MSAGLLVVAAVLAALAARALRPASAAKGAP